MGKSEGGNVRKLLGLWSRSTRTLRIGASSLGVQLYPLPCCLVWPFSMPRPFDCQRGGPSASPSAAGSHQALLGHSSGERSIGAALHIAIAGPAALALALVPPKVNPTERDPLEVLKRQWPASRFELGRLAFPFVTRVAFLHGV